jgi:predicted metal-binding protein
MAQGNTKPRALGQNVDEQTVRADLENYQKLAQQWGASAAAIIPSSWVTIDERVRLKCTVPRCMRAGETPNCPPHAPELDLVRKALSRYHYAILFKCDVGPIEDYAPGKGSTRDERRVLSFHEQSGRIACELERQAYKDGYHLAMGFGGGSCKDYLCKGMMCQYLDSGKCRFPTRARPAMEGVGMDVLDLVNKAGWQAYALLDDLQQVPCAITVGIVFVY